MKLKDIFAVLTLSAAFTLPSLGFLSYQIKGTNNHIVAQTAEIKGIKSETQRIVAQMDRDREVSRQRFEELAAISDSQLEKDKERYALILKEFKRDNKSPQLLARYP